MSWLSHGAGAVAIGARMVTAGAACLIHAVVPALLTETAGRTVEKLSEQMKKRKAVCPDWPDYEI